MGDGGVPARRDGQPAGTGLTGGLNITLFSYDGSLDFGLIACREMVPDVWNLLGYLEDAMAEMLALVDEQ